jgi:hypothetical protein
VAVVGPDAETLCTDLGLPLGERRMLSSELFVGAAGYWLDIIALPTGERIVRLRRQVGSGPIGIAALVPATLFLPQVSTQGGPFSAFARIMTRQGTIIGEVGGKPRGETGPDFVAVTKSEKFGFDVEIVTSRARIAAQHADLKWFGLLGAGIMLIAATGIVVLIPRRTSRNPMADIEHALEAGEFIPYYQPIVDIRTGRLRGAEVLVRWRKPDGSLVLPGAFIPLMESSGLIHPLTRDLMQKVCDEAGPSIGRRSDLRIAFNFAGKLFSEPTIVKDVRDIFANSPLKFSQVVLEVTERDPIVNFTKHGRQSPPCRGSACALPSTMSAQATAGFPTCSSLASISSRSTRCSWTQSAPIATRPPSSRLWSILRAICGWMLWPKGWRISNRSCICARSVCAWHKVTCSPRRCREASFLQLVEAIDPLQPAAADATEHIKASA